MAKKFPQDDQILTIINKNSQDTASLATVNTDDTLELSLEEFAYDEEEFIYDDEDDLIQAVTNGNLEQANHLIETGADVDDFDEIGATPLLIATQKQDADIVELLLKAGADINATINSSNEVHSVYAKSEYCKHTALMIATQKQDADIVELLLKAGADVNLVNEAGQTAMDIAINTWPYEFTELVGRNMLETIAEQ